MSKKKQTLKSRAEKALKGIERKAKRLEKRGYSIRRTPEMLGQTRKGAPKTRYTTKEVERLEKMKTGDLYKNAKYVMPSGEVVSGEEGRRYERRQAGLKGAQTRREREDEIARFNIAMDIISNFLDPVKFPNPDVYDETADFINRLLSDPDIGPYKVADALQEARKTGLYWKIQKCYELEKLYPRLDTLESYIPSGYEAPDSSVSDTGEDDAFTAITEDDDEIEKFFH